jgi:hypothetical protein
MEYFFSPAFFMMLRPVAVPPVKETAREAGIPAGVLNVVQGYGATAGDALVRHHDVRAVSSSRSAVSGESSDIFSTAVLPNARHGATFQVAVINGTFHGDTSAQTPTGCTSV